MGDAANFDPPPMDRFTSGLIKKRIEQAIATQVLKEGSRLPSVRVLAVSFGVSVGSIQKAIRLLEKAGLVTTRDREGTFACRRPNSGKKSVGADEVWMLLPAGRYEPKHLENSSSGYPGLVYRALLRDLKYARMRLRVLRLKGSRDLEPIDHSQLQARVAGLVLFEIHSEAWVLELRRFRIPVISLDYDATRLGVHSAVFANTAGTFEATTTLLRRGHRRIAFVGRHSAPPAMPAPFTIGSALPAPALFPDPAPDERSLGYELAMSHANLPMLKENLDEPRALWRARFVELLARRPPITAAVVAQDFAAFMLSEECRRMGYRIPEDLSIISFAGSGAEFLPGRTMDSVAMDPAALGAAGCRLLLQAIERPEAAAEKVVIPAKLLAGHSVSDVSTQEPARTRAVRGFRKR